MLERSVTSESEETVHSKVIQVSLPTLRTSFPGLGQTLGCSGMTTRGVLCVGLLHGGTAMASRTQPVPASGPALGVGCGAH